MKNMTRKGFTIIETMIATSMTALVIVAAVGSWVLFMHKSNKANSQAFLDMDARRVVEQFRHEVRNAARETIMFYPENQEPYQAMGFALAEDTDNDGLMDMDESGSNILWRKTVVYHVYNESDPPEMRRTVFSNRDDDASRDEYYNQLASVAQSGNGGKACLSGEDAETKVMFANLFTGKLWHAEATFDGYAPKLTRERITFGSMSLKPGAHQMELTITGQNPDSSGYAMQFDQLSLGVCGAMLEAESCEPSLSTWAGPNLAGAAYYARAETAGVGDKLSVKLYNDAIEEAEFIGAGRNISQSNTVVKFEADDPAPPPSKPLGYYTVALDGQFTESWDSKEQTDGGTSYYAYNQATNCILRIPILSDFIKESGFGPIFRLKKWPSYYSKFNIVNPYIIYIDNGKTIPLEFYQNGKKKSWADCTEGFNSFVELRPENLVKIEELGEPFNLILEINADVVNPNYFIGHRYPYTVAATNRPAMYRKTGEGTVVTNDLNYIPLLEDMIANYADCGEYISHPYDTHSESRVTKTITWEEKNPIPDSAVLQVFTRSGNKLADNGFEIADAPSWDSISAQSKDTAINGTGRYIQFRVFMKGQPSSTPPGVSGGILQGPYVSDTPKLNRVFIQWDGEEKYVDITGTLMKNPDCGIFKVEVDGNPLIRGVTMEIEIFSDIGTMGNKKERLRSSMMAEIEPRNSKKD